MAGETLHYALDIGSHALKLVRFVPGRRPRLVSTAIYEMSGPQAADGESVRPGEACEEREAGLTRLTADLRAFLKNEAAGRRPIYVSLPSRDTFIRYHTLPRMNERKICRIMPFEAAQQIPFPMDEVLWDYVPVVTRRTGEQDFLLSAVHKELAYAVRSTLAELGFSTVHLGINHYALYQLARFTGLAKSNVLFLDLGERSTAALILDRGAFWSRELPFGAAGLAAGVSAASGKTGREARELLHKVRLDEAGSESGGVVRQAAEKFFTDLASEVLQSVGLYGSHVAGPLKFDRVLLTGGLSLITGLTGFLQKQLDAPVFRFDVGPEFQVGPDLSGRFGKEGPLYAVALGLLAGCARRGPGMDLAGSEEHQVRGRLIEKREQCFYATLVAFFLAACLAHVLGERSTKQTVLNRQETVLSAYRTNRREEETLEASIQTMASRLSVARREVFKKSAPMDVLAELQARTPQAIWLEGLDYDAGAARLILHGRTRGALGDIDQFAEALERSPWFEGVQVRSADIVEGDNKAASTPKTGDESKPKWSRGGVTRFFSLDMQVVFGSGDSSHA